VALALQQQRGDGGIHASGEADDDLHGLDPTGAEMKKAGPKPAFAMRPANYFFGASFFISVEAFGASAAFGAASDFGRVLLGLLGGFLGLLLFFLHIVFLRRVGDLGGGPERQGPGSRRGRRAWPGRPEWPGASTGAMR
jgi:hypothetical protein